MSPELEKVACSLSQAMTYYFLFIVVTMGDDDDDGEQRMRAFPGLDP